MMKLSQVLRAVAVVAIVSSGMAQAQTFGSQPAKSERATERSAATNADFDRVNPGIGFGWFGISDIPIGGTAGTEVVSAPVLGVRWWMGAPLGPFRAWGLDLGVGLGRTSIDPEGPNNDTIDTGLLLHAGLPLVLSASQHVAIELVPEINLGIASGERGTTDVSGSRFDIGARAGAEVFFGFMGLPQLSLEGSVGFFIARESRTIEAAGAPEVDLTQTFFGTTKFSDPWDIFRGTVAARYYF